MRIEQIMSKCFGFSPQTYFNWKKEEASRPIITLISKYFSKEDLIEFLDSGRVSKLEIIKNTNNFDKRLDEIIRLLQKYDIAKLSITLSESLSSHIGDCGTIKYLTTKITKFDFIKIFRNILDDLSLEKSENNGFTFENAINDFNYKIGFDFNISDRAIIENIISRYKVYNTLYDLDKTN